MSDSPEAATLIHQEKFDGIFLDLMMPVIDGIELTRRIRQSSPNKRTPIVIVTARDDKQVMAETFNAGALFFLHKPVTRKKLTDLLNSTRGIILEERRRSERIAFRNEVTYHEVVHKIGPLKLSGIAYNLSFNGMLFQAVSPLELGSTVRLSFRLAKQGSPIEVGGIVTYFDESMRAGVRFTQIAMKDYQHLKDFVASQTQSS